MLSWPIVDERVRELVGRVYDSPFETIGRFAAWVGMSPEVLRQWTARGVGKTMLARLLAEASTIALSDWMVMGGERERLHDDNTGALDSVWAVGLMEDVGLNPARVRLWLDNQTADAEERLALLVCLTREAVWKTRYESLLADRNRRGRGHVPESHRLVLEELRRERIERGYSQRGIAELLDCCPAVISYWETGIRGYSWRTGKPTAAVAAYAALVKRLPVNGKGRTSDG
jgi:hypothetical protein